MGSHGYDHLINTYAYVLADDENEMTMTIAVMMCFLSHGHTRESARAIASVTCMHTHTRTHVVIAMMSTSSRSIHILTRSPHSPASLCRWRVLSSLQSPTKTIRHPSIPHTPIQTREGFPTNGHRSSRRSAKQWSVTTLACFSSSSRLITLSWPQWDAQRT